MPTSSSHSDCVCTNGSTVPANRLSAWPSPAAPGPNAARLRRRSVITPSGTKRGACDSAGKRGARHSPANAWSGRGTARVGRLFGPVTLVWFVTIVAAVAAAAPEVMPCQDWLKLTIS